MVAINIIDYLEILRKTKTYLSIYLEFLHLNIRKHMNVSNKYSLLKIERKIIFSLYMCTIMTSKLHHVFGKIPSPIPSPGPTLTSPLNEYPPKA